MTGAIHSIQLRRIWSKMRHKLYPGIARATDDGSGSDINALVQSLRQELDKWHASTPKDMNFSTDHPLSVFTSQEWFRLAYDHSILLLYRRYLIPPKQHRKTHNNRGSLHHAADPAVDAAFVECATLAREMCLLYRRLYQNFSVRYTWGSLHHLFLAGITYLHCLWSSPTVRRKVRVGDVCNTCNSCTMVLVIIAERWSAAAPYRDIFEMLAERTISMVCDGPGTTTDYDHHVTDADVRTPQPLGANAASSLPMHANMDDWITSLGNLVVPTESEWLVENLFEEMDAYQEY